MTPVPAVAAKSTRSVTARDGRGMSQTRVRGFRATGIRCGIKPRQPDLALIVSDVPAAWAGVYTRSSVVGAPVEWNRARTRAGRGLGVVVNSGVSNVATGAQGRRDAKEMATLAARATGCRPEEMCVASTGIIGQPLPMARLRAGIPRAVESLSSDGWKRAAQAIRTTDTFPKLAHTRFRLGGRLVNLLGIAKGSGMIEPNMATLLAFFATDAAVAPAVLRRALRQAADISFNRVSIDGETSTSDMALLFANGESGASLVRSPGTPDARRLQAALDELATSLAREIARDGEGATRLIDVEVTGARSQAEAERAARRIANSMLVKTAVFGRDPNWGRILQTVGAARVTVRLPRVVVRVCGVPLFQDGAPTGEVARRKAARRLRAKEVKLSLHLGAGRARAGLWTCDLSTDYVRINAEYTT